MLSGIFRRESRIQESADLQSAEFVPPKGPIQFPKSAIPETLSRSSVLCHTEPGEEETFSHRMEDFKSSDPGSRLQITNSIGFLLPVLFAS
jgi:hypothetical protein